MKNSLIAFTGGVIGSLLFSLIGWWIIPLTLWGFPPFVLISITDFEEGDELLGSVLIFVFWPILLFFLDSEEWKEVKDFLGLPNIKIRSPFYIDKSE